MEQGDQRHAIDSPTGSVEHSPWVESFPSVSAAAGASPEFADLVAGLLEKNPARRIGWATLRSHPCVPCCLVVLMVPCAGCRRADCDATSPRFAQEQLLALMHSSAIAVMPRDRDNFRGHCSAGSWGRWFAAIDGSCRLVMALPLVSLHTCVGATTDGSTTRLCAGFGRARWRS